MNSDRNYKTLEAQYWKTAGNKGYGDFSKSNALREAGKKAQAVNKIFLNSIALQTLVTFILQIVGRIRTNLRVYAWTKWIFGVLFVLTFLVAVLIGLVPTGPMV